LSARAAYGAELRRQIEEKERDKKLKRGLGKQIQYQNSQGFENELFGKNQHERTRVAAGLSGQGSNNLVLPPLNMLSRPEQLHEQQRQYQQPEFRARNEITAPGKGSVYSCGRFDLFMNFQAFSFYELW
jgi:hypothetical protein